MTTTNIVQVFNSNFGNSTHHINQMLPNYNVISIDTAFPGFLRKTPRQASSNQRYDDFRYNVEKMKLIQVGISLSNDHGDVGGTWQFNLSDFNPEVDAGSPDSLALLRSRGTNFATNMAEGVPVTIFANWMRRIIALFYPSLTWITFNGLYDLGYLLLMLNGSLKLPTTQKDFHEALRPWFGSKLYDVRAIAEGNGLFDRNKREFGLDRLAEMMGVVRSAGVENQAGSDCLLTANFFLKMRDKGLNVQKFEGCLYGIERKNENPNPIIMPTNHVLPPMIFYPWLQGYPGGFAYPIQQRKQQQQQQRQSFSHH